MNVTQLRQYHPELRYTEFGWHLGREGLVFSSRWELSPGVTFTPQVTIKGVTQSLLDSIPPEVLDSYAFHLGMMELPSYWKLACPPKIVISAAALTPEQLRWWQDLLINGLGEFFFVNMINFSQPDFVSIECSPNAPQLALPTATETHVTQTQPRNPSSPKILIPIGGGKDSVVTHRLLRNWLPEKDLCLFILNADQASHRLAEESGLQVITAERLLDPLLLDMNKEGYLNGHTPFSAYLAFVASITASLFGFDQVAVSNERSANEGNSNFYGSIINHQYSKSSAFETLFREYLKTYLPLPSPVSYFSFLRPLYELQIAKLFHSVATATDIQTFRSCNRGQKQNIWCERCPKCLFAYTILYPFLPEEKLTKIFSHDLFGDLTLRETALELIGRGKHKPLECVGMYEESLIGYYLSYQKIEQQNKQVPFILAYMAKHIFPQEADLDLRTENVLRGWDQEHYVPDWLSDKLKTAALN